MLYRSLLYTSAVLVLCSSCSHDTDKPIEQPDTTAQVQAPAPPPDNDNTPAAPKEQPEQPAQLDTVVAPSRTREPERIVQKGPAPEEKGDTAPGHFLGMKGTFSKEASPRLLMSTLRDVRSAQHEFYDRITFEFDGELGPGYRIEYIPQPQQCGSGDPATIEGTGWIEVAFTPARAHNDKGKPTVARKEYKFGYPVMREVERTCDFEGTLTYVIGVASPHKFRIIELNDPPRLCIDIDQ